MISAPPTPMRARTAMSCVEVSTKRTARLDRPKIAMPVCSARLRPNRSPRVPMVSSRPAKETRYESTIHCNVELDASKCSCSDGSATLRMVLSSPMMTRLRARTRRVFQRRWYARAADMA
jgi:hypothetical protein